MTQALLPKLNLGGSALHRLEDFQRDSTYESFRAVITKFICYLQELSLFGVSLLTFTYTTEIIQLSQVYMIYKLSNLGLFYLVFIVILFLFIMLLKTKKTFQIGQIYSKSKS